MQAIFRPRNNLIWASVAYLLLSLFVVQSIFFPAKNENLWLNIGIELFSALAIYLVWIRPKIVFRQSELVVVNPLVTKTVSYASITALDTRWALKIEYGDTAIRAWVAPANSRRQGLSKTAVHIKGVHGSLESSNISDSALAARLINERIENLH